MTATDTAARAHAREASIVALLRALHVALARAGHRDAPATRRVRLAAERLQPRPGWSHLPKVLDRLGEVLDDLQTLEPHGAGADGRAVARHAAALRQLLDDAWSARLVGEAELG